MQCCNTTDMCVDSEGATTLYSDRPETELEVYQLLLNKEKCINYCSEENGYMVQCQDF